MAFNANTESLLYDPTRNSRNLDYSAGSFSSGAGAAVGSGMVPIAHANDGGGSIRVPAACNGVVGMKVSRGRTPGGPDLGMLLWGLGIELVETRSIRDSAALLGAISAPDDGYFYMAPPPRRSFLSAALTLPGSLRIAVVGKVPDGRAIKPEIADWPADTVKLLGDLGHRCELVGIVYEAEMFNESTIRLWATTLGYFMEKFA